MKRYERGDVVTTVEGEELPDLDEMTLQWVLTELEAYEGDEEVAEDEAANRGDDELAACCRSAAAALEAAVQRLSRRALDRKHAR